MPAIILEWAELVVFMDQVPGDEMHQLKFHQKKIQDLEIQLRQIELYKWNQVVTCRRAQRLFRNPNEVQAFLCIVVLLSFVGSKNDRHIICIYIYT